MICVKRINLFSCSGPRSSKELRIEFLQSEALKKKCCLSESSSEFISFSETAKKFSNSFGEHASFRSFLTLRKEHLKTFLEFIPMKIGAKKSCIKIICSLPAGRQVLILWYFLIKQKVQ